MKRRSSIGLLGLVALMGGCAPEGAPEPLKTEDVTASLDAELSFDEDTQAVRRAPELAGVLPSDFPEDFPIFKPSTVVDFGEAGGGRYFVRLYSAESRATVQQQVNGAAPRSGWSLQSASPDTGEFVFRSRGRTVVVKVSDESGGTEVHIEY